MQPNPAATVVLARQAANDIEILLLLRNSKLKFKGGQWVFPGGRIDPADYPDEACEHVYHAAKTAAVRETREEANVDIKAEDLIHIAHWTTPEGRPRRFSTWFFVCPVEKPETIVVDNSEILDFQWLSPTQALHAETNGDLPIPIPTVKTLESLASYRSLEQLRQALSDIEIRVVPEGSPFYDPREKQRR